MTSTNLVEFSQFLCGSGASFFLYPLHPIKKIKGNWYNCINDVIVLNEFAKPAFCIKTNEGLTSS